MEVSRHPEHVPQFNSPEEEVRFLREQIALREHMLEQNPSDAGRHEVVREELARYAAQSPEAVLSDEHRMKIDEIEHTVLHLSNGHDKRVEDLTAIMESRGIRNALAVVEKLGNAHVQDDFHRFLVQYLAAFGAIPGLKENEKLFPALRMKLYEITLPEVRPDGTTRTFKELVSGMEQFYAGMLSVGEKARGYGREHFTLELALSNYSSDIVFYACVPLAKADLFEKQLMGVFHDAKIEERKEDYNPFNIEGGSAAAYALSKAHDALPLKTYEAFDHDPLNVVLTAFSKIAHNGEGAAIQFVYMPAGDLYRKRFEAIREKVKKGEKLKDALQSVAAAAAKEFFKVTSGIFFGGGAKKKDGREEKPVEVDEEALELLAEKIASPIFDVNLRIMASADTEDRAHAILGDLQSAFNQFGKSQGNALVFESPRGVKRDELIHEFTFRLFSPKESIPLNTRELTTMFHFPVSKAASPHLKVAKGASAAVPSDLSPAGVVLGINRYRGVETTVRMGTEDRVRHCYVIGQTGTGKTTLLKNMIVQDIAAGHGVCMIDPHGTDIVDILANIPKERVNDVIYFDPAYASRPMGLNMLEYDKRYPEQKTFVVNEMLSIFNKLFDMKVAGGPMFEQYFRNAVLLVLEDTDTADTLLEVSRVLADARFRELKLLRCRNPIVVQFWREIAGKAGGEASLANIVPYITSKFDVFLSNDIMRPIIAQGKSAFNFRQIMDERKILLVNLSKGRLGDINAHLIGLILVGKILMAALSRVDSLAQKPADFYLYIDEFQNITTDSIATILSEARKYRLSLNMAHQFIAQLDERIRDAVFGNVGSMAVFRVGAEDAEFLQKQFEPVFSMQDIMNLENRNAYVKMLVNGYPAKPFNIVTLPPPHGHPEIVEKLKELSYLTYGRERGQVEAEIMQKYMAMKTPPKVS